ncbi:MULTISPECIES: helix-hairpin-helix domain-containing protein [Haloarcula]|uniref:helix-hairpin-helix domain-containing protein n=1 Tax=Haloarcula TaxID=2237 RepID=UPI0023E85531|nr:helix-hairpin-helix domain-containing protein [Halomicroarcula sp. SHR3]
MGLLQKLKSALGLNGTESSESGRTGDVDVTVEREPSTEDEDAVKGTETASSGVEPDDSATSGSAEGEGDDPSADEFEPLAEQDTEADETADADAEPETTEAADTDVEPETADTDTELETAETAPEPEEAATDAEAAPPTEPESDDETAAAEPDAEAAAGDAAAEGSTDPVTELNGIGPAYGDRLAGAGIETVGELAGADSAELADQIDLGESRVSGWVEQANEY